MAVRVAFHDDQIFAIRRRGDAASTNRIESVNKMLVCSNEGQHSRAAN